MTDPDDATAALASLRAAVARIEAGDHEATTWPVGPRGSGPPAVRPHMAEPRTAGPKGSGAQPVGPKGSVAQPVGPEPTGPPTVRPQTADPQTAELYPIEPQTADHETGEPTPELGRDGGGPAKDPYAVARAIVLRQLSNAPKTRQQLREVLARRDCPGEVAEAVLDRMAEVGLVDDTAYAQMLVRSKQAGRGLARRALAHELRKKGVDDETAAQALDAVDPAAERRAARRLVDKKLATMHGLDVAVQTRRLAGLLARKGYPGDVAYGVIRDALADAPEHRRD